ncbi:MAG: amino acid ABC transporter ATP-binding protein [Acidobacteria bacterium]|nr:amino acid ABC transporter ATP-binding protein [Acidobacteriota bacterium]
MTTLEVRQLAVSRGGRVVLRDVTLSAAAGELLAVIGASGSGKTSLLRAISGLDRISAGSIEVGGVRLLPGPVPRGARVRALHRAVSMVFQFHHLFSHLTAVDNVWLAPVHVLGRPRAGAEARARALLDELGVGDRAGAMPHELSGGEAQRVAVARALAVDPSVLLMDEPTASLDAARRGELAVIVRRLADQGRTVVVATHDTEFVRACAHRAVVLDKGCVAQDGSPADVLRDAPTRPTA